MYRLLFHRNVEKQLSKIPRPFAERLAQKTRQLKIDPRPSHSKQLDKNIFRLREGDYHVVYAVFDEERVVYVGKIVRRTEKTYRDLSNFLARARIEIENQGWTKLLTMRKLIVELKDFFAQMIDFDVAVEITDSWEANVGIGVFSGIIGVNVRGQTGGSSSEENKIKFSKPIIFPSPKIRYEEWKKLVLDVIEINLPVVWINPGKAKPQRAACICYIIFEHLSFGGCYWFGKSYCVVEKFVIE